MSQYLPDPNYVKIFDTTLRDGEQAPGNSMNLDEKVRLALQLERLGVDVIEAGFPIASPDDFAAVQAIARQCKKAEVCGLARATEKDIQCAFDAIKEAKKPRIHTFLATSEIHLKHKLKKTEAEVLEMAISAVRFARSLCERVDFSPEDACRSNRGFMFKVLEAVIAEGADTLNIPDTVGYTTPEEYADLIAAIIREVPGADKVIISTHCHDDLGMAVANSLAGVKAGARQIECTINGIGERAGNAALEEVVMALQTRSDYYGIHTGINTKEIYPSSKLLSSITGVPVQPNKAIVGANAFAHESGIHQDGVLKQRATYEIMQPTDVGIDSNKIVLGKHSGRHAIKDRLETLGYELSAEELEDVFVKFKELADKKKQIFDADLHLLVNEGDLTENAYTFKNLKVVCGNKTTPCAEMIVVSPAGDEIFSEAVGDGPVDAAYGAVNKILQVENQLMEYSVNAITEGIDAQATVNVQVMVDGQIYSGNSNDTDIVVASVKAYLDCLNRALAMQSQNRLVANRYQSDRV